MKNFISIKGAREHNLKNIDVEIPKNKLVVFTGISGSGKSSLAFDTIFAEGQRRYVESLSAYARQFLGVMDKPDIDKIEGLSPAISIGQKEISHNPRSTVGTITETYDYLRLLFARVGHPHCPQCGREIATQTVEQIVERIIELAGVGAQKRSSLKRGIRLLILAPLVKDRKGEYSQLFEELTRRGFTRVRVDGIVKSLEEDFVLIRTNRHTIEAVVDRIVIESSKFKAQSSKLQELKRRLSDSVEKGLKLGSGSIIVSEVKDATFEFPQYPKKFEDHLFSEHFACPECNISLPKIEPRTFSFNSPHGACPICQGIGIKLETDESKVLNPNLSINEGGILPWARLTSTDSWSRRLLEAVARNYSFSLDTPIKNLPENIKEILLFGAENKTFRVSGTNRQGQQRSFDSHFEGVISNMERRYEETESEHSRQEIEKYMVEKPCPTCKGSRLKPESLSITIDGNNIAQITKWPINEVYEWTLSVDSVFSSREKQIAKPIFKELKTRLNFLLNVGLDYLSLDRKGSTLSVGEAQRIRLASQLGSGLTGILYILDEPSIGLHAKDMEQLLKTLKELQALGNTLIIVEHDLQTIKTSDWVLDFGPGAGENGGKIVAQGTPEQIAKNKKSLTGQYLSGKRKVEITRIKANWNANKSESGQGSRDTSLAKEVKLLGCQEHNLKNIDVSFPLGKFTCITGVSGSGKSSLILDTLYKILNLRLNRSLEVPGKHQAVEGIDKIDKVINIDQLPIGRTPRSNPATYVGAFTPIRELFTQTPESRARGYQKGRFSFNVKGGRCEACQGEGQIKIEMQFMPDVYVDCEVCIGNRFNRETLEIKYKNKNIADVLQMSVEEALNFFTNIPQIKRKLQALTEVGLSYIRLGQIAPTLSGGEAQRIKLARELSKKPTGKTFYILDEPTTGLHPYDIEKLLIVLHRLVSYGNTVVVIEHNLDVIKIANWIIDLGPEGGDSGGKIVACGTVDDIMKNKYSYTGKYLKKFISSSEFQSASGKIRNSKQ